MCDKCHLQKKILLIDLLKSTAHSMAKIINKYARWAAGAALGAVAGFLYWRFIGCNSGTCPITSNPYNTMAWFAVIGMLLVPAPKDRKKEESNKNN